MKTELTSQEILNLKFFSDDLDRDLTVKEFMIQLLTTLWKEGEGFSGKRPFGNSGWDSDLVKCLVENKVIPGKLDEDGYLEDVNWDKATEFVVTKIIPSI